MDSTKQAEDGYRDIVQYLASRPYVVYETIGLICDLYGKNGTVVVQDIGKAKESADDKGRRL